MDLTLPLKSIEIILFYVLSSELREVSNVLSVANATKDSSLRRSLVLKRIMVSLFLAETGQIVLLS